MAFVSAVGLDILHVLGMHSFSDYPGPSRPLDASTTMSLVAAKPLANLELKPKVPQNLQKAQTLSKPLGLKPLQSQSSIAC